MSWRTVIVASRCKLDLKMGYMVIRGEQTRRIFLDEIAMLIIENPAVSLTGCLLEALVQKKIRVIFCDGKRSPMAELVREFDRDKLFVTVNMRTFFADGIMERFLETVRSHEFHVLMLESQSYARLAPEKRITIDADLCEF